MASVKSSKRTIKDVSSDSDSDMELKKAKRADFNELFSIKLSPYSRFHCAVTNGLTEDKNILFVNIRNGYSVYGAGKGMILQYDELVHIFDKLNYREELPKLKLKSIGVKLTGKPKNGKFEFERSKGGKKTKLALPIPALVGFFRLIPAIRYIMETIKELSDHEGGDRFHEEFINKIQKSVMTYIKDTTDNEGDFTKADLRRCFWIYCGLAALFNIPAFQNPYKPDDLKKIFSFKVDGQMQARVNDIIDYILLKVFI